MNHQKSPPGGAGIGHNINRVEAVLYPHCTTNPPPIQFPYTTDLAGLLAQADERHRRANSRGDEAGAVAHLSVWFAIHPLVMGYGGE